MITTVLQGEQSHPLCQGRTKDGKKTKELLFWFALHGDVSWPRKAAENSTTHHPLQIETWHHLCLRGNKTTRLTGADSSLRVEDGGDARKRKGEVPGAGGGLSEEWVEDQVNAIRVGQSGIRQIHPEQGLRHKRHNRNRLKKSHRQQHGGSRKSSGWRRGSSGLRVPLGRRRGSDQPRSGRQEEGVCCKTRNAVLWVQACASVVTSGVGSWGATVTSSRQLSSSVFLGESAYRDMPATLQF